MRRWLIHILFWLAFFFIWNRIVYFYVSNFQNRLYFTVLDVSLIMSTFYVVYAYLVPFYIKKKKTGLFIGALFAVVVAFGALHAYIMMLLLRNMVFPIHFSFSWNYSDLQYNRLFIALLGTLSGCVAKLAINWVQSARRIEQMEKEKAAAELIYLKEQLNPHFLFNSLNSLYAQLEAGSADTKNTLSAIADLLRFQLYDCDTEFVAVTKEIEYLKNYFALQRIRKENCEVSFFYDEVPAGLQIAPLLLIPFIENAFKYVSDNDETPNFIKARLSFNNHSLRFYCSNTVIKGNSDSREYSGIGLSNVKKRLNLIYGGRHQLTHGLTGDVYNVDLQIRLA